MAANANHINSFSNDFPVFPSQRKVVVEKMCPMLRTVFHIDFMLNEWCSRPQICTVRLYWAGDNLGFEMNYVVNHALAQD